MLDTNKIYHMDCIEGLKQLDDKSVQLFVSSPPYNVSYRSDNAKYMTYKDNLTEKEYIEWQTEVFKEMKRCLKDDGVILWNFMYGAQTLDLPYKLVPELQKSGLKLFETIMWQKKCAIPITTANYLTRMFEFIWLFAKQRNFAMNKNEQTLHKLKDYFNTNYFTNVWQFPIHIENQYSKVKLGDNKSGIYHHAVFPVYLPKVGILLYTKPGDLVVDPFMGSGTTAFAAKITDRKYIGFDIEEKYIDLANKRIGYKTVFDF